MMFISQSCSSHWGDSAVCPVWTRTGGTVLQHRGGVERTGNQYPVRMVTWNRAKIRQKSDWKSNSLRTFRGVYKLHLSFHSGATVQSIQVSWSPPPGWGPHPLPPGAARACPDAASHDAHVPPHSASEGRGLPVGHQAGHHCRGAPSGERRERDIQVVCKSGSLYKIYEPLTGCIIVRHFIDNTLGQALK